MLLLRQTSLNEHQDLDHHTEDSDWETSHYLEESDNQPYLPSPQEIERHCREIRRSWSEAEYRKRAGHRTQPLELATTPCRISFYDLFYLDHS